MSPQIATAYGFALVLLRTAGLCSTAPILAARVVPARLRLALSLVLAFAVHAAAGSPAVEPPDSLFLLAATAAGETAMGALAGLAARWVLEAALAAGSVASLATGMGFGALVDPSTGAEATGPSELIFAAAQATAVALGIHREAVAWLARSTRAWPPGGALDLPTVATHAVGQATLSIALAVRLAFPVLAAVIVGHGAMALTSRMAPQLNLSNVGFSVAVLAGGLAFYLAAPAVVELAAGAAVAAFPR